MSELPRYSWSSLNMMSRCGWQWKLRYVDGQKAMPTIPLLIGTGVHHGAAETGLNKIETGRDLPVRDIIDLSIIGYESELEGDHDFTKDERIEGKDEVAILSRVFAKEVAPKLKQKEVERSVEFTVKEQGEALFRVKGYLDYIEEDGFIGDLKTSKSRMNDGSKTGINEADRSTQLTIYAAAYFLEKGVMPKGVRYDTIVKAANPYHQRIESVRVMADVESMMERFRMLHRAVQSEVFLPTTNHTDCTWCGYRHTCQFAKTKGKS